MTLSLPDADQQAALVFWLWLATTIAAPALIWVFERDRRGIIKLSDRWTFALRSAFRLFVVAFVYLQWILNTLSPRAQDSFPFRQLGGWGLWFLGMDPTNRVFFVIALPAALTAAAYLAVRREALRKSPR